MNPQPQPQGPAPRPVAWVDIQVDGRPYRVLARTAYGICTPDEDVCAEFEILSVGTGGRILTAADDEPRQVADRIYTNPDLHAVVCDALSRIGEAGEKERRA